MNWIKFVSKLIGTISALLLFIILGRAGLSAPNTPSTPAPQSGGKDELWRYHPVGLTNYYNYALTNSLLNPGSIYGPNNLGTLPKGFQVFSNVLFDVNGIIQLASRQA